MAITIKSLKIMFWVALISTVLVFFIFVPIPSVKILVGDRVWFKVPVALGGKFETLYEHSVQKTPVIDEYVISCGRIWQWQERVKSHNAGLPFEVPRNGKFLATNGWFYFRGGRWNWNRFFLRVGNDILGKNIIVFGDGFIDGTPERTTYKLFTILRGRKLVVQWASTTIVSCLFSNESLRIVPNMVE
ncbi:MAG: hypothetical protein PWP05_651 [Thermovirga sp.]|nr:hypothetical protein [Thermovirga sp.]